MFDDPSLDELLAVVATLLRDTLPPQLNAADAFQARVAANALELVRRQLAQGDAACADAARRLHALLGPGMAADAPLSALQAELARRIRSREFTPATPGLLDVLQQLTLAKMAVEQPGHALYRHLTKA